MKKKTAVIFFSFLFAGMVVLTGFFIKLNQKNRDYQIKLGNVYMQSIDSLCNGISNINVELKKSTYVTTPEKITMLAAEIYHESGAVMSALAQLPAGEEDLSEIYKFISQAGDYTVALSKKAISDGAISDEERKNLETLASTAQTLSAAVEEMRINYENGSGIELEFDEETDSVSVSRSLAGIRDSVAEYPTLIYDGPYSDHILEGESQLLAQSTEITAHDAKKIAAQVLKIDEEKLNFSGEIESKLAAYRFDSEDTSVAVTKRGGYILYFRKFRTMGQAMLDYEQAVKAATLWLEENTNLTFSQSYYFADEGVCTVNFAYKEGATVCYTDLIKVGVALDTGEIVLCEANGYIMNHKSRTIKTPDYTEQQAAEIISPSLTVNFVNRVLIPSGGGSEIPCYEFKTVDGEGQEVLIYINQDTLSEERVYLVLNTEGGTLTK